MFHLTELLGSIEAGGTKFVLATADADFNIQDRDRIPTTTPAETIQGCIDFFTAHPVAALGLGSFGPIDQNLKSPTYGRILATPKPGWANTDIVGELKAALHIPIFFTTDVNASVYGEYIQGAAKDVDSAVYFTIGTGIGGGAIQDGHFIGGRSHSEMGHATVMQHPDDDFAGVCPFHGNKCFEGLASGPAIEKRTGKRGEDLPRTDRVFDFVSYYVAQLCLDAYLNLMPEKIILGGSVISATELPKVRKYMKELNNGYVSMPDDLVVLTEFPNNASATVGDFALAKQVLGE